MMVDIVVPVWNEKEWAAKCIQALRKHTPRNAYRLHVIDNGSDAETARALRAMIEPPDALLRLPENLGFIKAANCTLVTTLRDVVLLNSDCIVKEGWFDPLLASDCAITSPVNNHSETWQNVRHLRKRLKDPGIPDVWEVNGACAGYMRKTYPHRVIDDCKVLAFFCVFIHRETIQKLGPLDERFGMGQGEDRDYCIRALKAGLKLGVALDSVVWHASHKTFVHLGVKGENERGENNRKLKAMYPDFDFDEK